MIFYKRSLIFILCFFSFINVSHSEKYRLIGDPDYYFNVNKDKYISNDEFDKISKQINNQYQGELKILNRRPEFDLYEYNFTFMFGYNYSFLKDDNISTMPVKYKNKYAGNIGVGVYWSNNYRLELEYIEHNARNSEKTIENKYDLYLLTGTIDYYRYQSKFRPYLSLSVGAGHVRNVVNSQKGPKEFLPIVVGGAVGIEQLFSEDCSLYLQYRYIKSLRDAEFSDNKKISYESHGIGFGFRVFIE